MDRGLRIESMARLLVLTEQTTLPMLRSLGLHEAADELLRMTTAVVVDPENTEAVTHARKLGFRWMEGGD